MNISAKLPEYSRDLLRLLDPAHELDHLQCSICLGLFNLKEKRPVIICKTKACVQSHHICEMCLSDMVKQKEKDGVEGPLKCPYCKENSQDEYQYDSSQNDLIARINNIFEMLEYIFSETKRMTEEEYDKKLREIVQKAQDDIFTISVEERKKGQTIERLRRRIQQLTKQNQKIAEGIQSRQKNLQEQLNEFEKTKERILTMQRDSKAVIQANDQMIKQLQEENKILKQRLSEHEDIKSLQNRMVKHKRRSKPNSIFIEDAFFTQFKFHPLRNQFFVQNFTEKRPEMIIQLRPQRQKYFQAISERKCIYHSEFFSYNREEDRLIYFQMKSHNKNILRYKFGLADQDFNQIKSAKLYLNLDSPSEEEPFIITFFINLVKMKLYATTGSVRKCEKLPELKVGKFTVFLYFVDMKTQLGF